MCLRLRVSVLNQINVLYLTTFAYACNLYEILLLACGECSSIYTYFYNNTSRVIFVFVCVVGVRRRSQQPVVLSVRFIKVVLFNKHFLCAKLSIARVSGSERKTERENLYTYYIFIYNWNIHTLYISLVKTLDFMGRSQ